MRCEVKDCNNKKNKRKISFFTFPSDPKLFKQWIKFCCNKNINTKTGRVCMEHFKEDDFENKMEYESGFATKLYLKRGATPTVHKICDEKDDYDKEREQRAEKRENKKIVEELIKEHDAAYALLNGNMDIDQVLIQEVRKRPNLYDSTQADYKNLKKKEFSWKEIAAKVNLNELTCKKRWKGLRDSYKRCKRTQRHRLTSGSSNGDIIKKKWKYYDLMSFLDNVITDRRTLFCDDDANLSDTKDVGSSDAICINSPEVKYVDSPEAKYIDSPESKYIESTEPKYIDSSESCFSPFSEVSTILDTKEENDSDNLQEFIDVPASGMSETSLTFLKTKEQDSTALHFAILAKKIKEANMPPQIINRIEAKVSKIIFEEIEQFYSES